jgi:hypothetical protein
MKIEDNIHIIIEELDAQAEVVIPPLEMNDIRRERSEYLSQTVSDLYDRVVYMVRMNNMKYDPEMDEGDEEDKGPKVILKLRMGSMTTCKSFWMETRRERQNKLMASINELFDMSVRMHGHLQDVIREEENDEEAK